jgi:hypothetical protein
VNTAMTYIHSSTGQQFSANRDRHANEAPHER